MKRQNYTSFHFLYKECSTFDFVKDSANFKSAKEAGSDFKISFWDDPLILNPISSINFYSTFLKIIFRRSA
jgi:hypothetical protein